jgi:hypothetical protein
MAQKLQRGEDNHFTRLFDVVVKDNSLSGIVARMSQDGDIPYEPANQDFRYLIVLGIAKLQGHRLAFRNRLYADLASRTPKLSAAVPVEPNAIPIQLPQSAFSFMADSRYQTVAYDSYKAATVCHKSGSYRFALVAYGSALEAVLIDWLMSIPAPKLATAETASRIVYGTHERRGNPQTWTLFNLFKVAAKVRPAAGRVDPPNALREWRNLVHPAVAVSRGTDESVLIAEATAASGFMLIAVREAAEAIANP